MRQVHELALASVQTLTDITLTGGGLDCHKSPYEADSCLFQVVKSEGYLSYTK